MNGREFESFIGRIFSALGHNVKLTHSTGDQGVDVLVEQDGELVAIQCKNLARPASNKPVQEVYAGAKYYGTSQAWVVAPAGYTDGAFQLADQVGVELYDRGHIRAWIEQVNLSGNPESYMTDAEIYELLVEQHTEYLELLIEAAKIRHRVSPDPEVGRRFEQSESIIEARLGEVLSKMQTLDERNPGETEHIQITLAESRASVRQMASFLNLAAYEDVFVVNYEANLERSLRRNSGKSTERIILRPRVTVGTSLSEEIVTELSKRAFCEHADQYHIEVEVEPMVEKAGPDHPEETAPRKP